MRLQTRRRVQPITEIHADLTNHMRFCFKDNNRNITMTMTNMTTLVQMRQCRLAAHRSALSKPNLPDCQRLLVALRERSLCSFVNFIVNIMIHYVKCYCLVYFFLLFLLIILTSEMYSVLNCLAAGTYYFHNRYFLFFFVFILGYFSTRGYVFLTCS